MRKFESIFWTVIASVIIALIMGALSINYYLNMIMGTKKDSNNENFATYSIQHEDNPLNKNIKNFDKLYSLLVENQKEGYTYYEIYMQYLENTKEHSSFYSQETGMLEESCKYIQCIQLSLNTLYDFDIILSNGKLFQDSDYIYIPGNKIPILLGDDYSDFYSIGDTFHLTYLFDEYVFAGHCKHPLPSSGE